MLRKSTVKLFFLLLILAPTFAHGTNRNLICREALVGLTRTHRKALLTVAEGIASGIDALEFKKEGETLVAKYSDGSNSFHSNSYHVIDFKNPDYYGEAFLENGELLLIFEFKKGPKKRSKVLYGREQFIKIFNHFGGKDNVKSIRDVWRVSKDTNKRFNSLISQGIEPVVAVWDVFTGKWAKEVGFTKAEIIEMLEGGTSGGYDYVAVRFTY